MQKDKYYNNIKTLLIDNEIYQKVKDYSKERNKVITYYETGKLLYEAGKHYGENIIEKYSEKLMKEVGKKYNKRTLFRMRQFYMLYSNEKMSTMSTLLSWSHYSELLSIKDINKINYYISITISQSLGVRELRKKIKNKEYERLPIETKEKLFNKSETIVSDFIKNPILINNTLNYKNISEKALQLLILENITDFMKELGVGFSFIDNEYKIKIGDRYNYIDLLLFNYVYNCFVVIELKTTELKAGHIGQITEYMNFIDKNLKSIYQSKTIGIIICKNNNKFVLEYCSDTRIFTKEYKLI